MSEELNNTSNINTKENEEISKEETTEETQPVKFDEESDPEVQPGEEEEEEEYVDDDSGGDFNPEDDEEEEEPVIKKENTHHEDDDDEQQDDDYEIKKTKKRKRKEKKKTEKPRKRKSKVDLDEEETSIPQKKQSEENEEFDQLMKEFKIVKGKKIKDSEEISNIEEQAEKMAKDLIDSMKQAYEEDNVALENKKPATSKLKILSSVVAACSKSFLQPQLIEEKLLDVLAEWIKPTEDKQLPNMNIRSAVFKILSEIPVKGVTKRVKSHTDFDGIEVSHLRGSEIGKLIKMYSIHPKETQENRKLASLIIEKWSRMIFDLSDDYKATGTPTKTKRRSIQQQAEEEVVKSNRARIPKKTGFDFVRQPKSKVEDDLKRTVRESTESEKALQRKLRDLSRKQKF